MANHVRLASVAPARVVEHHGVGQDAVDRMIRHWDEQLRSVLPDKPDLILLPEYCDSYRAHTQAERIEYLHQRGHQIRDHFASIANRHRCYIGYSAVAQMPDGRWGNALQVLDRQGNVAGAYFKNYLTASEAEDGLHCGNETSLFQCDFGTVAALICFDLNFDRLRDQYRKLKPDLILFPSLFHGGLAFNYFAYSCRCHIQSAVAGLPSQVVSPVGHSIASTTNYHCHVVADVNLDCRVVHLDHHEEKIRDLKQQLGRQVDVFDPGLLGSVLISSESEQQSADQMLQQFGIEPIDEYLERSSKRCRPQP